MHTEEMRLEIVGKRLGDGLDRDAARVRRDDRARLAVLVHLGEDLVLDIEIFDYGLDHQVAILQLCHVVGEIAEVIIRALSPSINGAGFSFFAASNSELTIRFRTFGESSVKPFASSSAVNSRGAMSRRRTGIPAFARWAAIPAPIVPAPKTAAFPIFINYFYPL